MLQRIHVKNSSNYHPAVEFSSSSKINLHTHNDTCPMHRVNCQCTFCICEIDYSVTLWEQLYGIPCLEQLISIMTRPPDFIHLGEEHPSISRLNNNLSLYVHIHCSSSYLIYDQGAPGSVILILL